MISAADRVQYVAVIGLILKLPNVCLYFWMMRHIERMEELQLAIAFSDREWSCCFSSCGECWFVVGFSDLVVAKGLLKNGPQRSMMVVWYTMNMV